MTRTNSSIDRQNSIIHLILKLPGINQSQIRDALKNKNTKAHATVDKEITTLLNLGLVKCVNRGKSNHYYIVGAENYDSHLHDIIRKINDIVAKIKPIIPNHQNDSKEILYNSLTSIQANLQRAYGRLIENKNESDISESEDYYLHDINEYSIYEIDEIQQYVNKSQDLQKEIKSLRDKLQKEIKSLRDKLQKNISNKSQNQTKNPSCNDIVVIQTKINKNLEDLVHYVDVIPRIKSMEQEHILEKLLCESVIPHEVMKNIASLAKIKKIMHDKNIPITHDFESLLSYFHKSLKPIKKDMFIQKLVDTKKFTKKDAINLLHRQLLFTINDNKIYPTFSWLFR